MLRLLLAVVLLISIAGCEERNVYSPPPPPDVTVAEPLQRSVTEYLEFTGTTRASKFVEVRARVPGYLESMYFVPGTKVEQGQLLFVIDRREYEAAVAAAQAELEAARAQRKRAEIEYDRAIRLQKQKAGTDVEVVKWRGERDVAEASVLRAEARLERAELDLSFTEVTAPITGRVSRNLVDPGNLVGEGEATLLTTVTDYSPMYAYFDLNERDFLKALQLYRARVKEKDVDLETQSDSEAEIPVEIGLADEEGYPHAGVLDFAESSVDPETGTLRLRGVFPNDAVPPSIYPGLFVRVRMPLQERENALLVSERAIGSDQGGRYLLVVDAENLVEKRAIRQGQLTDGLRVIEDGLRAGERVVVRGIQRARPGAEVQPQPVDMASLKVSALRAAAEDQTTSAEAGREEGSPVRSSESGG